MRAHPAARILAVVRILTAAAAPTLGCCRGLHASAQRLPPSWQRRWALAAGQQPPAPEILLLHGRDAPNQPGAALHSRALQASQPPTASPHLTASPRPMASQPPMASPANPPLTASPPPTERRRPDRWAIPVGGDTATVLASYHPLMGAGAEAGDTGRTGCWRPPPHAAWAALQELSPQGRWATQARRQEQHPGRGRPSRWATRAQRPQQAPQPTRAQRPATRELRPATLAQRRGRRPATRELRPATREQRLLARGRRPATRELRQAGPLATRALPPATQELPPATRALRPGHTPGQRRERRPAPARPWRPPARPAGCCPGCRRL